MAISTINNVNNNIRNLSFGENLVKTNNEKKPQISTQTKVLIGAGLTALAAVGIYIATKRRTKSAPKLDANFDLNENIHKVINSYKERYSKYFTNVEPKVTSLKNGKTKIEFLRNETEKHVLICNKNGVFEKRIVFNKNKHSNKMWYNIYNNFENGEKNKIRSFISKKNTIESDEINVYLNKIEVKEYKSGRIANSKHIGVSKNSKYAYVYSMHENELIKHRIVKKTIVSFDNEKPQQVFQTIKKDGLNIHQFVFKPKKDSIKEEVTKTPFAVSNELMNVLVSNRLD